MVTRANQDVLHRVYEGSGDAIALLDHKGIVYSVNGSFNRYFSIKKSAAKGKHVMALLAEVTGESRSTRLDLERILALDYDARIGLSHNEERTFFVEYSIAAIPGQDGSDTGALVMRPHAPIPGVTNTPKLTKDVLADLLALNPNPVAVTRVSDGKLYECNENFLSLVKGKRDEVVGKTSLELNFWTNPVDRKLFFEQLARDGQCTAFTARMRKLRSGYHYGSMAAIRVTVGRTAFVITYVCDISPNSKKLPPERPRLKRTEDVLNACGIGAVEMNIETGEVYYSPGFYRLFGYTEEDNDLEPHLSEFERRIHPEERTSSLEMLYTAIQQQIPFEGTYRLRHRDRTYRHFEVRSTIAQTNTGPFISGFFTDVTDSLQVQSQYFKINEQFRTMTVASPIGVYMCEADGTVTFINERTAEIVGVPSSECLGNGWVRNIHPDDEERVFAAWNEFVESPEFYGIEHRYLLPDKTVHHVLCQAVPERDEKGEVVGFVGAIIDITAQRAVEEKLYQQEQNLNALINSTEDSIWSVNRDVVVTTVNAAMTQNFGLAYGTPLEVGLNPLDYLPKPLKQTWADYYRRALDGEAFQTEEQYEFAGIRMDTEIHFRPIRSNKVVVGAAVFARNVTEQRSAARTLKQSEAFYRTILEKSFQGVLISQPTGRPIYASSAVHRILGYSPSDVMSLELMKIVHPDDVENLSSLMTELICGKLPFMETSCRVRHSEGNWRYLELRCVDMIEMEAVEGIVILFQDVTEKHEAVQAMQESEERYRMIFETAREAIIVSSPEKGVIDANIAAANLLGYDRPEDMLGVFAKDIYTNIEQWRTANKTLGEDGFIEHYETELLRQDGSICNVLSSAVVEKNRADETRHSVAFITDITERKNAEREIQRLNQDLERRVEERTAELAEANSALQEEIKEKTRVEAELIESKRFIERVLETSPYLCYVYELPDGNNIYASQNSQKFLGLSQAELSRFGRDIEARITHPDDLKRVKGRYTAVKQLADGEYFDYENRTRDSSGKWRWMLSRESVFRRDPKGRAKEVLGIALDISERKETEVALRKVVEGTVGSIGVSFFDNLTEALASALGTSTAFVCTVEGEHTVVQHSSWVNGQHIPTISYEAVNTPCELAVTGAEVAIEAGVNKQYPTSPVVAAFNVESYFAMPMYHSQGGLLGYLGVMSDKVITNSERATAILKIFAARAAVEFERDEILHKLEESERRYKNIVEDQTELICRYNEIWHLSFVNEAFCDYFGETSEIVVNRSLLDYVVPGDRPEAIKMLVRLDHENPVTGLECQVQDANSRIRWQRWTTRRLKRPDTEFIEYQTVARDITTEKMAQEALTRSENRLASIFQTAAVSLWEIDVASIRSKLTQLLEHESVDLGEYFEQNPQAFIECIELAKVVSVNRETLRLYEADSAMQLQESLPNVLGEDSIAAFTEGMIALVQGAPQIEGENVHYTLTGKRLYVLYRVVFPSAGNGLENMIMCIVDISERERSAEKIRGLNFDLATRAAELHAANKELESFSYSISHDLRAPLRAIDGFSLAILEDHGEEISGEALAHLHRVRKASGKMSELIDDLLRLSRTTRSEMNYSTVNLSRLADDILLALRSEDLQRSLELKIEPDVTVYGDANLLKVALQNLFSNAWKFTKGVDNAAIEFGTALVDGQKVYFVSDNGAGFDMRYSDKLFGPFQRLHPSHEFEGTGIGLATVQRIVRRHAGVVWGNGEVGKGARFSFTLGTENLND